MGLSAAFGIGRSALAAYQAALQVVGQNIANAATPGYTRASADLIAIPGAGMRAGQLGNGVFLSGVRRNISESLQARLRSAGSDVTSADTQRSSLNQIEGILDPLGDSNLGALMSKFFKSVGDLQNNPQNSATRSIVITSATSLTDKIRDTRAGLMDLQSDLNKDIESSTQQADLLASQIADLNIQITTAEAGSGGTAAGLRDQRDQLLTQLGSLMSITVREQPSGAVNVYVGNDSLIQFGESFGLKAETETGADGYARMTVRFKINNGQVNIQSGNIAGLIASRDSHAIGQLNRLDQLAGALINEVNKIHAGGRGLEAFSSITSTNGVTNSAASLSTADNGLDFVPQSGSFFIDVTDSTTGTTTRHQINIDLDGIGADSSLDSVMADINANVPGVTATIQPNGTLKLAAAAGSNFTFADDTSGFLSSMGINTFFTGKNSLDINVNALVVDNPQFIAAGRTALPGDGSNATDLASLQNKVISDLGGVSLNEYYNATTANLAVTSSSAQGELDASDIVFQTLTAQRESISGVNMDEEAVNMISYQRAYEGAARYMGVVDDMLQTLLGLLR
jgi:flagellar hook-associated protein 1 FlgK